MGPVIKFDGFKFYGGPFYYCMEGEIEIEFAGSVTGFDLKEESRFGGYAGVIVDLGPDAAVTAERHVDGRRLGRGRQLRLEF